MPIRLTLRSFLTIAAVAFAAAAPPTFSQDRAALEADAKRAYNSLVATIPAAKALNDTAGFEVGVGPSVVVVDEGMARTITTTTVKDDVYAFVFGQKGLMAGVGLQGNKITKLAK